jgi:hypothetical protein
MSDDCLNDSCFRPVAAGKKHDQFLDIPDRPYLSLTTPPPTTTTSTTTTTTSYPQDLLDIIHLPTSGQPCPFILTTTTTTTTTENPLYSVGGLKAKFNMTSSSLNTIAEGNVGINIPITNGFILSNISYDGVGNNYSFIAFGYFKPPVSGPYIFHTTSEEGSAVWLDSLAISQNGRNATNAIINNSVISSQGVTKKSSSPQPLSATKFYPIRIVHRNSTGSNSLTFSWSGPNIPETTNLLNYFYYDK